MRFLPIVERELRVAARRRGTYQLRAAVALTMILVSGGIFLFGWNDPPREIARTLFYALTGGALLFCLLAGMRSTADCLSEEKRDGTLGLLFLTDLKGYDVVLGKLAANSLGSFYGLLAVVPVMAIPLLLGGVSPGEFARVAAVLVNALFVSLCLGMFASACSRSARKAIAATLLLVLLFTVGGPVLGAWLAAKHDWIDAQHLFAYPSAVYTYVLAQDSMFKHPQYGPEKFYTSLAVLHALGWLFLGWACVRAPRSWQDRPAGVRGERWRAWWQSSGQGDAAERAAFRTRLLEKSPFFWLAARARLKPAWVWAFLGGVACVWVWGAIKFDREWFNGGVYVATAFLLNSVLKNWVASEAARQLSEDRRMGTLELLLSTPLGVREILRGQALALRRQFFAPVAVTLGAEVAMLVHGVQETVSHREVVAWKALWCSGMIMLVADLVALYWVGMWMGLAAKNPKRAFSETVGRVLAVPWVGFALFMALVIFTMTHRNTEPNWQVALGVWVALGLAADVGFGAWARHKLLTEFREVATRRYEQHSPLWRRWRSRSGAATRA